MQEHVHRLPAPPADRSRLSSALVFTAFTDGRNLKEVVKKKKKSSTTKGLCLLPKKQKNVEKVPARVGEKVAVNS